MPKISLSMQAFALEKCRREDKKGSQGDVYTSFLERLNRRHEANKKEEEMKITKRQLRRIIKEVLQGENYRTVIVMSPTGDSVLIDGQEVDPRSIAYELEVASGQSVPSVMARDLENKLMSQMRTGYVEMPISWSPNTGWKIK